MPQILLKTQDDAVIVVAVFQNVLDLQARESLALGHHKLLCGCILLKVHLRHMFRYQYRIWNMWPQEGCIDDTTNK